MDLVFGSFFARLSFELRLGCLYRVFQKKCPAIINVKKLRADGKIYFRNTSKRIQLLYARAYNVTRSPYITRHAAIIIVFIESGKLQSL